MGNLVASARVTGNTGLPGQPMTLTSDAGIHRVRATFDTVTDGGPIEDNAGIDDVTLEPVTPCR